MDHQRDLVAPLTVICLLDCIDTALELQEALPFFAPKLTRHLSIDQLCKIIVEVGRYCAYRNVVEEEFAREQARSRSRRVRSLLA